MPELVKSWNSSGAHNASTFTAAFDVGSGRIDILNALARRVLRVLGEALGRIPGVTDLLHCVARRTDEHSARDADCDQVTLDLRKRTLGERHVCLLPRGPGHIRSHNSTHLDASCEDSATGVAAGAHAIPLNGEFGQQLSSPPNHLGLGA